MYKYSITSGCGPLLLNTKATLLTGIGIGVALTLIGLFIIVQYNLLDSEDFRVIPKTTWFEYRANCLENLCYVRFLEPYYNSTTLNSDTSGDLEGSDFATTTRLIKYHLGREGYDIVDVRYGLVKKINCEVVECFDEYVIELQARGDHTIQSMREFGWIPSNNPFALG